MILNYEERSFAWGSASVPGHPDRRQSVVFFYMVVVVVKWFASRFKNFGGKILLCQRSRTIEFILFISHAWRLLKGILKPDESEEAC